MHGDIDESAAIYEFVNELARKLGANPADQVPFEKYANAANSLLNPSSAARAIAAGAPNIERVDRVVQIVAKGLGLQNDSIDTTVRIVDARLEANRAKA